jgi:hypothetical protein
MHVIGTCARERLPLPYPLFIARLRTAHESGVAAKRKRIGGGYKKIVLFSSWGSMQNDTDNHYNYRCAGAHCLDR